MTVCIRTCRIILLRQRINGRPCSRAVVEAGAEVAVGDAEGGILLLLAGEAPAVGRQGRQAVGVAVAKRIIVVLLLNDTGGIDDCPYAAQMIRDVVVHGIGVVPRPADTPAAEGNALQGLRPVRSVGVGEGSGIVVPRARRIECFGHRPVGEVCVVGFHGGPGLDLCRQVKQIVRRLQVIGSVGGDIAVDIVGIVVPTVTRVGVREGGRCAGIVVPGKSCDVACLVIGDRLLGECVGYLDSCQDTLDGTLPCNLLSPR